MVEKIDIKQNDEKQIVIFNIGDEEFGVDIKEVREIIRLEKITPIPNSEGHVKGVINLRGGIIVIADLAKKLGLETKQPDHNTRIIVVEKDDSIIGMIVDSATEVLRLPLDKINPAPASISSKINTEYIEGVGILEERLLILLNLSSLMDKDEIESTKDLAGI